MDDPAPDVFIEPRLLHAQNLEGTGGTGRGRRIGGAVTAQRAFGVVTRMIWLHGTSVTGALNLAKKVLRSRVPVRQQMWI